VNQVLVIASFFEVAPFCGPYGFYSGSTIRNQTFKEPAIERVKREGGENPLRSRRCNRGPDSAGNHCSNRSVGFADQRVPSFLKLWEGADSGVIRKPEDLPESLQITPSRKGVIGDRRTPDAVTLSSHTSKFS
jgi:hypothetical protein